MPHRIWEIIVPKKRYTPQEIITPKFRPKNPTTPKEIITPKYRPKESK